jgi:hypothetical protein
VSTSLAACFPDSPRQSCCRPVAAPASPHTPPPLERERRTRQRWCPLAAAPRCHAAHCQANVTVSGLDHRFGRPFICALHVAKHTGTSKVAFTRLECLFICDATIPDGPTLKNIDCIAVGLPGRSRFSGSRSKASLRDGCGPMTYGGGRGPYLGGGGEPPWSHDGVRQPRALQDLLRLLLPPEQPVEQVERVHQLARAKGRHLRNTRSRAAAQQGPALRATNLTATKVETRQLD